MQLMTQNLTNTQVLLNEYIRQESAENQQYAREDDFFEFFAASQVLKEYDLSAEEVDAGICDAAHDGGCDSMYIFTDGMLLNDDVSLEQFKRGVSIDFYIIQAKNTASFGEAPLQNWKTTCSNLLDMDKSIAAFSDRYNQKVRSSFELFKNVQIALVRKSPKINIHFCYITKGVDVHPNVNAQAEELRVSVQQICPNSAVDVAFVGAGKLWELVNRVVNNEFQLTLSESPITSSTSKVFVGLVKLSDYYRFMINDNQELIRHIFEANVRDYQGRVAVNKDIQDSLETPNEENFWWLNNGTTIIASDVRVAVGRTLIINDPEIVNGLQTSTEIYNYFKNHPEQLDIDMREILVRIIVPESEDSRDRIIFATNNQTPMQKSSLRATDIIHRQIEMYFKSRGLYYDRRKNYYKNNGKTGEQIVSLPFLSQCLMSVLMQSPNDARARPSTLLADDMRYDVLYRPEQNLDVFYNIAITGKRMELLLKRCGNYSITQISDIRFYVLYLVFSKVIGKAAPTPQDIFSLSLEAITVKIILETAAEVYGVYLSLGGTDKVAKGSELIAALQKDFE